MKMNKITLGFAMLSAFLIGIILAGTNQSFITPAHAATDGVDAERYELSSFALIPFGRSQIFDTATGAFLECTIDECIVLIAGNNN